MNQTIRPAPVRRSVTVKTDPVRAFELFTAGIGRWWPKSHSIGGGKPQRAVVIEPRVGGRWYEISEDGSECEWGSVLAFEPPSRLMLNWQLDADWKFDADLVTEVEIVFSPAPGGGTLVELEHRNLERFGERTEHVMGRIGSPRGWLGLLEAFATGAGSIRSA